jgi:predicted metal-binding membrane protein
MRQACGGSITTATASEGSLVTPASTLRRVFVGGCALLFAASAALTIVGCENMSRVDGMPMAGGWTMSMTWMRMPGQSWCAAAASFLAMWIPMMIAMMLPAAMPRLWLNHRAVVVAGVERAGRLTATVGAAYFSVWAMVGAPAYALGVGLAAIEMRHPMLARSVPSAIGVAVLFTGLLQFTKWKTQQLARCHGSRQQDCRRPVNVRDAWRCGTRLGLQCIRCCGNLMALPLLLGMMDLRVMAAVTAAVALERLARPNTKAAVAIGAVVVTVGLDILVKAMGSMP